MSDSLRESGSKGLDIKGLSSQNLPVALVSGTIIRAFFEDCTLICGHLST